MSKLIIPEKNILFQESNDIKEICNQIFSSLNITHFHYTRLFLDGTFLTLSNNPFWQQHFFHYLFLEEDYTNPSNCYIDYVYLPVRYPNIAQQAKEYGIQNMFSIVSKTIDYYDVFGFGLSVSENVAIDFYFNNIEYLKRRLKFFREKAKKIIRNAESNKLKWKSQNQIRSSLIQLSDNQQLREINSLTNREIECLEHISNGMSAKEVANILGISPRTVETHISNIKIKTNLNRKYDLINYFKTI